MSGTRIPSLASTFGVGYIGVGLATILYGITCAQLYWYFELNAKDRTFVKVLAVVLWILDSFHQALIMHAFYYYLITEYANPVALESDIWSLLISDAVEAINSVIVESFFLRRLWIMSDGNKPLCMFIFALTWAHFALSLVWPIKAFPQRSDPAFIARLTSFATSSLAMSAVTDMLIACGLCYFLYRGRTGFTKTDSLVNNIMMYTISTGLVTTLFSLGNLVTYAAWPADLYFALFNFILARLYPLSFLASLNTREKLRKINDAEPSSFALPTFSNGTGRDTASKGTSEPPTMDTSKHVVDIYVSKDSTNDIASRGTVTPLYPNEDY